MPEPRYAGISGVPALPGPLRNGLPAPGGYTWRGQSRPWAERRIAAAEAIHGRPDNGPDCRCGCGLPVGRPAGPHGELGRGAPMLYRPGHAPRQAPDGRCGGCRYLTARCTCPDPCEVTG